MAASYAAGFVAIAGVSITVLTLVLGFSRETKDKRVFLHIVTALGLATACCFAGTQLMSKTAALKYVVPTNSYKANADIDLRSVDSIKSRGRLESIDSPQLSRSYLLGSSLLYSTGALFLFALALLPMSFGFSGFPSKVSIITFISIQIGTYIWHFINLASNKVDAAATISISVVVLSFLLAWFTERIAESLAYYWTLASVLGITVLFMVTVQSQPSLTFQDWIMYAVASSSGPSMLVALVVKLGIESPTINMSKAEQAQDFIAKAVSGITSPFLTILATATIVIARYPHQNGFLHSWLPFLFFVIGFPLVYIFIGMKTGKITDIHVEIKEQRAGPYIMAIIGSLFLVGYYVLTGSPLELTSLALNLVINGIVFLAITSFWKISVHAAAALGSIVILALLISPYLTWAVLLVPLIIWARLRRKKHDVWQAITASMITGGATFVCLLLFGLVRF